MGNAGGSRVVSGPLVGVVDESNAGDDLCGGNRSLEVGNAGASRVVSGPLVGVVNESTTGDVLCGGNGS